MIVTCTLHSRAEFGCSGCILALARANQAAEIENAPLCDIEFEWEIKGRGQGLIQARVPEGWTVERVFDHYGSHVVDDINCSNELSEIVSDSRLDNLQIHRPKPAPDDSPKLWDGAA